ncbi:hypothetical protein CQW49_18610 [Methylosinus trichosporium OB3b]|uniref:Uncharacterized protein n=1 Tax=Methylosinus trichosporium (strain ATCC 35070 / NCIMB 11131 / UNIQEM 75 / OB3b) TaxID=595536 RepID=A0A2D2D3V8_METT3|nr:hypothetical protein CQW49_18610 [Methylosinus trichosporium OB3b]OBS51245.1 hypothetical protein A8B73_17485 [Methylosinus sp. 3S-1]
MGSAPRRDHLLAARRAFLLERFMPKFACGQVHATVQATVHARVRRMSERLATGHRARVTQ